MWRSKTSQLKTMNLCNQFLVIHLNKKKQACERIGMQRKSQVYNTAILSIKKYPLPIICAQQLKALYGIGDQLCDQLIPAIKNHYQAFLKKQKKPEIEEDHTCEEEEISNTQIKSVGFSQLNRQKKDPLKSQGAIQSDDDSMSNCSFKSATINKPYRPRPKTQGANILTVLYKVEEGEFISRQTLIDQLKTQFNTKVTSKSLTLTLTNLAKSGYIEKDSQDFMMIKLTSKGIKESEILEARTKQKDSSVKVKQILSSFLSKKQKPPAAQNVSSKASLKAVHYHEDEDLWLLVDTRQVKDKLQPAYFSKQLTEKYGIKVRTCPLPVGDFMWEYQGQVLDYVVQRKKADDLMSSILDGRYKEQKYRLKNSTFRNIYYLYEGHLTATFAKNQRQVSTALLNTRVRENFKVVQVNNITESVKFIKFLTQEIQKKLQSERILACLGSIQEVAILNGKASQLTVQNIFGLSLKTIPGIGKSAVSAVLQHFRSFRQMHQKLAELDNKFERVQFLKELLRGEGVRTCLPELLVGVLFGE